jgi:hypothetical protein
MPLKGLSNLPTLLQPAVLLPKLLLLLLLLPY